MSTSGHDANLRGTLMSFLDANPDASLKVLNETALQAAALLGFDLTEAEITDVASEVEAGRAVRLERGAFVSSVGFTPWIAESMACCDMRRWKAYRALLSQRGFNNHVLEALDQQTTQIAEFLGDPSLPGPWSRRGLVIGEVQSGKTGTYIGTLNKALDLGYKIVVIIGGHTEDLRRQTQERVDSDLIGRDSSHVSRPGSSEQTSLIGLGEQLGTVGTNVLTTVRSDFQRSSATSTGVSLGTETPTVFVVKKNASVLRNLAAYLRSMLNDATSDAKLVVIDDEADWASVNTRTKGDRAAVNQAIIDLLSCSTSSSYLGITATPFANVLIDDEDSADLFPKDYIVALKSPTSYAGVERYFGQDSADSRLVRTDVEDCEAVLPLKHAKNVALSKLPQSLQDAVIAFFIATAERYRRDRRPKPSSMMVNVSRFNLVQSRVRDLVEDFATEIAGQVRLGAAYFGENEVEVGGIEWRLRDAIGRIYPDVDLMEIRNELAQVADELQVDLVNSQTMGSRAKRLQQLTRDQLADERLKPVIFVGGNVLARGLTLDGLVISYFYRSTGAADTLLQMGRWFGYRPNYGNLVRVWLRIEVVGHFQYVAEVSADLRNSISSMHALGLTPKDFGLKMRMHPESFMITAANKARTATKKSFDGEFTYRGNAFETHILASSRMATESNKELVKSLIQRLLGSQSESGTREGAKRTAGVWRTVDHELVAELLGKFSVPGSYFPYARAMGLGSHPLPEGIASLGESRGWTVAVVEGRGDPVEVAPGLVSRSSVRNSIRLDTDRRLVLGNRRVAASGDISGMLTVAEKSRIHRAQTEAGEGASERISQRDAMDVGMYEPMLLVYALTVKEERDGDQAGRADGRAIVEEAGWLPALVMATPGLDAEEVRINRETNGDAFGVKYLLNRVATIQEMSPPEESEDEEDGGEE